MTFEISYEVGVDDFAKQMNIHEPMTNVQLLEVERNCYKFTVKQSLLTHNWVLVDM